MNFAAAPDQLRRQEIARLSQYVTPAVEALRSLTPGPLREQIALMVERLGHTVHNNPTAAALVTTKQGQKYIAFTKNVSEGLNMVGCAVPWQAVDNVILCAELEHPSNLYPWFNLKRRLVIEVRSIPRARGPCSNRRHDSGHRP